MTAKFISRGIVALLILIGADAAAAEKWTMTWASSQQTPEPANSLLDTSITDATLRQIVRVSIGGTTVRIQLSNAFGTGPLSIDSVHIALAKSAGSSEIVAASDRAVKFEGRDNVIIPSGASYWSDPVAIDVPALSSVAISLHLPAAPKGQTGHPGSRATSFLAQGNRVRDPQLNDTEKFVRWYHIAGLAVAGNSTSRAVVTLGDSITDGHGATTDGNDRWPDELAGRLHASHRYRDVAVANHGIGGNRLLNDGSGPSALARFDRDVLAQPGVRYLIVLEGVNDIGVVSRRESSTDEEHRELTARIIGAYRQIIDRAHAAGIKVYGATILPFGTSNYYRSQPWGDEVRQTVNHWIRERGHFDAVIDFDAVTRDSSDPARMKAEFDSGDGLHPSPTGYRAMANAIPLELFK